MPYYSKKRSYSKAYPKARHVDKKLLLSSGNLTAATQFNTVLFTPSVACTLKGLRVNGSVNETTTTDVIPANISWAILCVKEGYVPNAINTVSSGDFYIPEQDVCAWGVGKATQSANGIGWAYDFDIAPKTSRKMEEGDRLYMAIVSDAACNALINTQVFVYQ